MSQSIVAVAGGCIIDIYTKSICLLIVSQFISHTTTMYCIILIFVFVWHTLSWHKNCFSYENYVTLTINYWHAT